MKKSSTMMMRITTVSKAQGPDPGRVDYIARITSVAEQFNLTQAEFARLVLRVSSQSIRFSRRAYRRHSVTCQQGDGIRVIGDNLDLGTGEYGRLLNISPSTAVRNLSMLQKSGYITILKDEFNLRRRRLFLTPKGLEIVRRIELDVYESMMKFLSRHVEQYLFVQACQSFIILGKGIQEWEAARSGKTLSAANRI
jgi:DNA-binding MarR family transcriptional regulator